jgi:hypothetical protein
MFHKGIKETDIFPYCDTNMIINRGIDVITVAAFPKEDFEQLAVQRYFHKK